MLYHSNSTARQAQRCGLLERSFKQVSSPNIFYHLATIVLRVALVLVLFWAGWSIYRGLPTPAVSAPEGVAGKTTIQVILRHNPDSELTPLDIHVEFYPVDIVAVRHEYFMERRAGKRFDDFLQERMNGRAPVSTRLDAQGQASVNVAPGSWWLHAVLPGEEDLEWRMPINVTGRKQTVELTLQNVYSRSRSF